MTFEEEFPSLKKLTEVRSTMIRVPKNELDYEYGSFNGADNIALTLRVDEFSKFFLDKQRVKEVINNAYMNSDNDARLDSTEVMKAILFKELGLED